jgi:hypothetical protein
MALAVQPGDLKKADGQQRAAPIYEGDCEAHLLLHIRDENCRPAMSKSPTSLLRIGSSTRKRECEGIMLARFANDCFGTIVQAEPLVRIRYPPAIAENDHKSFTLNVIVGFCWRM